ncbi:MAG: FKBP-type peptidyl-prolyl cis-trans isomerase [Oleiphilaceae bacterium]|nr:FKBP-type peptidyl-prolyl cis-trans isomerase [Oleiphilaceae bacterium]
MKKTLIATAVAGLMLAGCADSADNQEKSVTLDTEEKRTGYSMGMTFANRMKNDLPDIEVEAFLQGVEDGLENNEALMSEEEIRETLQAFQQKMMEQQQQAQQEQQNQQSKQAEENKARAEEFLAENAKRDEVTVTDSGLQYEVLEEGDGASPDATDTVTVHYTGTLIDGTTFDSSRERGEPVSFPLQNVIAGWTEALQLMEEGARYKIYLPPELAYGPGGQGSIGPNEALIFDVELISVDE